VAFALRDGCPPVIRLIGVQPNEGTVRMIVIGADTHKGSHALAAVDEGDRQGLWQPGDRG
jgi:hypothetical protein